MFKKTLTLGLGVILIFAGLVYAAEESLTITTYYPSPYGVYRNLRLYPSNEPTDVASRQAGTMYFNISENQVYVYNGTSNVFQPVGSGGGGGGGIPRAQVYSATGAFAWTVPAGVTRVKIEMWGGGGGGAYQNIPGPVYHGGASGAYNMGVFDVTPGQTYTVIVGDGGDAGNNAPGLTGGESTVIGPVIPANSFSAGGGNGGWRSGVCMYGIHPLP
jgi:hypothetical protein